MFTPQRSFSVSPIRILPPRGPASPERTRPLVACCVSPSVTAKNHRNRATGHCHLRERSENNIHGKRNKKWITENFSLLRDGVSQELISNYQRVSKKRRKKVSSKDKTKGYQHDKRYIKSHTRQHPLQTQLVIAGRHIGVVVSELVAAARCCCRFSLERVPH